MVISMGQRILLSCEKCGCKKEMSVGVGLMSNQPDIIASCLNEEEANKWQQLYHNKKVASFRAEQKVYYCENCKDLFGLLSVDAELTDGNKVTFGNKCRTCRKELEPIELQAHMKCPICKSGDLHWKQTGLWD